MIQRYMGHSTSVSALVLVLKLNVLLLNLNCLYTYGFTYVEAKNINSSLISYITLDDQRKL